MIDTALAHAAARLAVISDTPRLDAELLLAHALGLTREALLLGTARDMSVPAAFDALVARRLDAEPIAYILGHRAFWTIDLRVTPAVLIPRPDSETLIDAAVAHFGQAGPQSVIDLGTGSGALLLAALDQWPAAQGIGVDRSAEALAVAADNGRRLGMADRTRFVLGDWAENIAGPFDLLLCNPPYVEAGAVLPRDVAAHEPHGALFAGEDGLDDYRRIAPQLPRLIAPGGMAAIEIGSTQRGAVTALIEAQGLAVRCMADLSGLDRCLVVTGR